MSKPTNLLVIIDPQNDFHKGGSLGIDGALDDVERIRGLMKNRRFDNIVVTLDTHQYVDIAHPSWWKDEHGNHPAPFTNIKAADVEVKWWTTKDQDLEWSKKYLATLEANKRFDHTIWPYHCIIGTQGHGVVPSLNESLREWSLRNKRLVTFMWKGSNPKAEMYSAFKADVEVPAAPETKLNTGILERMASYDNIFFCGQAMSHCVRFSFTDAVEYFKARAGKKPNCILLSDCASIIQGNEDKTKLWMEAISKVDFVTVGKASAYYQAEEAKSSE